MKKLISDSFYVNFKKPINLISNLIIFFFAFLFCFLVPFLFAKYFHFNLEHRFLLSELTLIIQVALSAIVTNDMPNAIFILSKQYKRTTFFWSKLITNCIMSLFFAIICVLFEMLDIACSNGNWQNIWLILIRYIIVLLTAVVGGAAISLFTNKRTYITLFAVPYCALLFTLYCLVQNQIILLDINENITIFILIPIVISLPCNCVLIPTSLYFFKYLDLRI